MMEKTLKIEIKTYVLQTLIMTNNIIKKYMFSLSREKYGDIGRKIKNLPIVISSSSSSLANSFSLRTLLTNNLMHGIAGFIESGSKHFK
jgi:hypothetical protein